MRNWDLRDEVGQCLNDEDCDYAMKVCKTLNIPFLEVSNSEQHFLSLNML